MNEAPRNPRPPENTEAAQPVEFTRGFIAFIGAMVVPAVLALAIFLGAWAVSGEVYAAEAAAEGTGAAEDNAEVAGWKQSLVGICPIH
mgnify:CR=1 FL=1